MATLREQLPSARYSTAKYSIGFAPQLKRRCGPIHTPRPTFPATIPCSPEATECGMPKQRASHRCLACISVVTVLQAPDEHLDLLYLHLRSLLLITIKEESMRLLLAIFLPFITFFTIGRPFAGLLCLLLQITLIGWLPAALWAVYALSQYKTDKKIAAAIAASNTN